MFSYKCSKRQTVDLQDPWKIVQSPPILGALQQHLTLGLLHSVSFKRTNPSFKALPMRYKQPINSPRSVFHSPHRLGLVIQ